MSIHGGFSQWTWQQAVKHTLTAHLHHQQYSESTDIQQSLGDGYSLQTKSQELIQTISVLLCEYEHYRQDLEAAHIVPARAMCVARCAVDFRNPEALFSISGESIHEGTRADDEI